jgi:hypothetical protein
LAPSISHAIYFNKSGTVASWINGVGSNGGTATIPPMQGFFMKAYASGKSVDLPASARVHSSTQTRYKGFSIIPLVRLKLENQTDSDDAVARFDDKATTGVDNEYDAYKFSKTGGAVSIWTSTGGVDFSINGLPFPETSVEIPVAIYSNAAGNLIISGSQIDGLDNYKVSLTDKLNNFTIDLRTVPSYTFSAAKGITTGQLVLKINSLMTAVPEVISAKTEFNIFSGNGILNIQTLGDSWNGVKGEVKIFDITGKLMIVDKNNEFSKGDIKQIPFNSHNGVYLVEITAGVKRYVAKVVVR